MTVHAQKSAKQAKTGKSESKSGLDSLKKWLGLVAAVLSLGSAVYGLIHAQADKRSRAAEAAEHMASGRLQEKAGDYEHAWDSFQKAQKIAAADGVISRFLLGGLSKPQQEAQAALEEVAEKWLREPKNEDDERLADNNAVKLLSAGVDAATGAHKADLLAHIGFAYFNKARLDHEEGGTHSENFYREAVAADPQNPYAHAFWGVLLLSNNAPAAQVKQHFAAALASNREHELVRQVELAALAGRGDDEADTLWWQAVNEMRKAGEPLNASFAREMADKYYPAASNGNDRKRLYAAVPPADHVELARYVLKSGGAGDNELAVKVMLAYSLEATGHSSEALAAWQDAQRAPRGDATIYNTIIHDALQRLGGAKAH